MDQETEKMTYINDGNTTADMPGVDVDQELKAQSQSNSDFCFKELWNTYWSATKKIIIPMLIFVGAMVILFLLLAWWVI